MPAISVIIPCYNQAHLLTTAIRSVQAQTMPDWEIIIVNDGSSDATAVVAKTFVNPQIHYVAQENMGLSAARNTGIEHANGRFICFLDADDAWAPEFFQTCLAVLKKQPTIGGVYTRHLFFDHEGNLLSDGNGHIVPAAQMRSALLEGGFFPVHSVMLRRSILDAVGYFDVEFTSLEDWDLWLRVSQKYAYVGIEQPLAYYRVNPNSMSMDIERMHANRLAVLAKHFGSLMGDPTIWPLQKRQAVACAYRQTGFLCFEQGKADVAWGYLEKAFVLMPMLLQRLDTFYEIGCGTQPRGKRGSVAAIDVVANGRSLFRHLDQFFTDHAANKAVQKQFVNAYSTANFALGMLSDQSGQWTQARSYLLQAVRAKPALIWQPQLLRRLVKVTAANYGLLPQRKQNQPPNQSPRPVATFLKE